MKVAMIISSMRNGGAQRVVSVLASYCADLGDEVCVMSLKGGPCEYEVRPSVRYLPCPSGEVGRPQRIYARLRFLLRGMKAARPDVIVSFTTEVNLYAILVARLLRIPVVISERNDPNRDPASAITRTLRDALYRFSNGYVFQTQEAADYFSEDIRGRSRVIPNPLKAGLPEPTDFDDRQKRIVSVARLEPQKNLKMLIDAFNRFDQAHPGYVLELYGRGSQESELRSYVEEIGLECSVHFCGYRMDIANVIRPAACFVLPSDYEGIPNALLEALAIGIPSISTDCPVGGPRTYIESGVNGVLVPVGDETALLTAIEEVLLNHELAREFSHRSIVIREILDVRSIGAAWRGYIDEFATRRSRRGIDA